MSLETYYLSSLSVAATLLSILLIVLTVAAIWVGIRLKKMMDKVNDLTATTTDMAHSVRELVNTTAARVSAVEKVFLTAQGIGSVVGIVANAMKSKSEPKDMYTRTNLKEGASDGKGT